MKWLFALALYAGVGMFFHALFVGGTIDPWSVWSWIWLLGWPVALIAVVATCFALLAIFFAWVDSR